MRRLVIIGLVLLAFLLALGVGLSALSTARANANKANCQNNLRMLALLGTPFEVQEGRVIWPQRLQRTSVWPGTVMNDKLPPDERLSWVVLALPTLHEKLINGIEIDRTLKWDAPINKVAGEKVLRTLICPAAVPPGIPGQPAPTMYVGISGLGADSATLPLTEPLSPSAGAFRYDAPTPIDVILKHDGVSQTFLFGQTTHTLGPWIRGGNSTVRGFEDGLPILAPSGGQFGGSLAEGAWFAFVDGSVRMFSYRSDASVLKSLATINGGSVKLEE